MLVCGLVIFSLLTMLMGSFRAIDFGGSDTIFYRLFSFGSGFIITVAFSILAFISGSE
jgi:hypothetical protein